jgi:NAD(P)-dependent dehydrogenase (short-subunit alcohol dehydrogenase family)
MSSGKKLALVVALLTLTGAARAAEGTVLITGSNRGIGFEFARQLAESGWKVIATTRNPAGAEQLAELAEKYPAILIEQLDVTSDVDIAALAEKYRDTPIDMLLLNAAKGPEQPGATAPLARQDMNRAAMYFDVNAVGPMKVTQAFMDNVKAGDRKLSCRFCITTKPVKRR